MSIIENINKFGLIAVLCLVLLNTCNTCNTHRDLYTVSDRMDSIQTQLNNNKNEISTCIEINSLETSKRILYDQNSIVRSVTRPDDRMNEYDNQIKELQKKIQK